jgi:hypothetical protein
LASRPASSAGRQPILARPPASAQVKPKKPQPHTSNSYFGKRTAALKAKDAIRDQYQDTEKFATECAIEAADQLEDARLPEDMGRMSITPSPQDAETRKQISVSTFMLMALFCTEVVMKKEGADAR